MGHNVQSQAGVSLSDVYDIKGGQAPIERLITTEVPVVHEMGGTIQSERFSATVRRRTTGALAQNISWDEVIDDLPAGVSRILGVTVLISIASRSNLISVNVRDVEGQREVPIFVWDMTTDASKDIRIQDDGAAVGNIRIAIPNEAYPRDLSMLVGSDQPQSTQAIAFRGLTSGFGAGTVEHILLIHLAFAAIGGISSQGLPIPSW